MNDNIPEKEMPKYKCHKIVWALQISAIVRDADIAEGRETDGSATITPVENGYAPFKVTAEYLKKHEPRVGGYYVIYEGGYESWSPKDAFEAGYRLIEDD